VSVQIEEIKRVIRVLPFVTKLSPVRVHKGHGAGWGVSLRCSASEEYASCGKKQEPPVQVSNVHPTQLLFLQELMKRLQDRHVECAQSVAKKAAADVSAATVSPDTPNVLQAMMQLRQGKSRTEPANKFVLETEKERDTSEKVVEELKRQLQPKRAHTDDDAGDAHGKGPWDGLGAMVKSKVTLDIMHDNERTSTGKITSAMLVAQHLRSIFCNVDWDMEHTDMKIQQVVVMYLNTDQISRPPVPPIVLSYKGIMSCFSFMCLGVPRHYARSSYSCWCTGCSRVRGRGHGSDSCGPNLIVKGCTLTNQTFWTKDEFTVTVSSGIRDRDVWVVEIVVRELEKAKPDKW
jgi:hypothetical protein